MPNAEVEISFFLEDVNFCLVKCLKCKDIVSMGSPMTYDEIETAIENFKSYRASCKKTI